MMDVARERAVGSLQQCRERRGGIGARLHVDESAADAVRPCPQNPDRAIAWPPGRTLVREYRKDAQSQLCERVDGDLCQPVLDALILEAADEGDAVIRGVDGRAYRASRLVPERVEVAVGTEGRPSPARPWCARAPSRGMRARGARR